MKAGDIVHHPEYGFGIWGELCVHFGQLSVAGKVAKPECDSAYDYLKESLKKQAIGFKDWCNENEIIENALADRRLDSEELYAIYHYKIHKL